MTSKRKGTQQRAVKAGNLLFLLFNTAQELSPRDGKNFSTQAVKICKCGSLIMNLTFKFLECKWQAAQSIDAIYRRSWALN